MEAEAIVWKVADELVDTASISDGKAVVAFNRTEAALADLRERFQGVEFDLTTNKGDTTARQARKELVSLRTGLDRKRKELKAPAVEFNRKIDSEAARLTVEIEALEDPIDAQIRADEARREEERQAKLRAEEARVEVHRQRIADISSVAVRAVGLSSGEVAAKIDLIARFQIDDGFEEFMAAATNAKAETLLRLQELYATARRTEDAAAEAERNRARLGELEAENAARLARESAEREAREEIERKQREAEALAARVRAAQSAAANELVEKLRRIHRRGMASSASGMLELVTLVEAVLIGVDLGDSAGVVQRVKDDVLADLHELHGLRVASEAEQVASQAALAAARAESDRLGQLAEVRRAEIAAMTPQEAPTIAPVLSDKAVADANAAAFIDSLPEPEEPATVTFNMIGKRLGFVLQIAFIEEVLGITHAVQDRRSTRWRESQMPALKRALIEHVEAALQP